jgi:hypothetical protein
MYLYYKTSELQRVDWSAGIYHYVDYFNKVDEGVALQKIIPTINYFDSEDPHKIGSNLPKISWNRFIKFDSVHVCWNNNIYNKILLVPELKLNRNNNQLH